MDTIALEQNVFHTHVLQEGPAFSTLHVYGAQALFER